MVKAPRMASGWPGWPCMLLCVALPGASALASPEPVPASVRACASLTDPTRRLACYDAEAGRSSAGAPATSGSRSSAGQPGTAHPAAPASPPPAAAGAAATVPGKAAKARPARTRHRARKLTAHVLAIQHREEGMFLRLDNGQVWQEVGRVDGDLSLKSGDVVEIEEHLGSFWLRGPHVYDMNVRQK